MRDEDFMRLAIRQAELGKLRGNLPFGAVVVRAGLVISRGYGSEIAEKDVTRHAETKAVSRACRKLGRLDLIDCVIYASGEPCNMCASAIFQAKVSRVVIAATRQDLRAFMRQRAIRIDHLAEDQSYRPELVKGVLREEALALFDNLAAIK